MRWEWVPNARHLPHWLPAMSCSEPQPSRQPFSHFNAVALPSSSCSHTTSSPSSSSAFFVVSDPSVSGSGLDVSLPVQEASLTKLRSLTTPSAVGKGSTEELDLSLRRSHEIDAASLSLSPGLQAGIAAVFADLMTPTGAEQQRVAPPYNDTLALHSLHLHKLLLYQPGDFFVRHRDAYKAEGMFATVIVMLPVEGGFSGGVFRVTRVATHRNDLYVWNDDEDDVTVEWDWTEVHPSNLSLYDSQCEQGESGGVGGVLLHFIAFYSDCQHELLPVATGHRLVLVYNLVRKVA
jgi:hypothetical protein